MAGVALQTDAVVLSRAPGSGAFDTLTVFAPEHGVLRVLHRVPRKSSPTHVALDLFDETHLWLEQGASQTWFVKEAQLVTRHTGIGQDYARLQAACAFAQIIARNPISEESRSAVHRLLQTALNAFATASRSDVVLFKSLYCLARDEGHPLKQQWVPTLPSDDRAAVSQLLTLPTAEQTLDPAAVRRLHQRLKEYLQGHTELVVD